ncbi:hypothetical protein GQ457_01G024810 [Hibiscus cannabinus]
MSTGSSKPHKGSRVVNCDCGIRSRICISSRPWSKGRRFYGCSQLEENMCNFFQWYDKEEDSENVEDLKDELEMLIIEIRKIKIENKELKELVRSLKAKSAKRRNETLFYKLAFFTSWIVYVLVKFGL